MILKTTFVSLSFIVSCISSIDINLSTCNMPKLYNVSNLISNLITHKFYAVTTGNC